ncbi:hypothetical protein [Peptacetobacter hiranonis]|uniref:hypothetical protein n=1 Tax=Peptacetobacter hiranonis TaxID=89152 RepID=UPI0022E159D0|nr:hypothetical protein [Peptacetobacter hiranonis]
MDKYKEIASIKISVLEDDVKEIDKIVKTLKTDYSVGILGKPYQRLRKDSYRHNSMTLYSKLNK